MVARVEDDKGSNSLYLLKDGLGALKDRIDPETADGLASTLVERMRQKKKRLRPRLPKSASPEVFRVHTTIPTLLP